MEAREELYHALDKLQVPIEFHQGAPVPRESLKPFMQTATGYYQPKPDIIGKYAATLPKRSRTSTQYATNTAKRPEAVHRRCNDTLISTRRPGKSTAGKTIRPEPVHRRNIRHVSKPGLLRHAQPDVARQGQPQDPAGHVEGTAKNQAEGGGGQRHDKEGGQAVGTGRSNTATSGNRTAEELIEDRIQQALRAHPGPARQERAQHPHGRVETLKPRAGTCRP